MSSDNSTQALAPKQRQAWLDIARGLALFPMASYHFMWDLADFGYLAADFPTSGWPKIYARAIASTFLFLAGYSLYLAHGQGFRAKSFFRRLGVIGLAAGAVSLGTYLWMPGGFIYFGILHAMATASIIGLAFLRAPVLLTLVAAVAAFAAPHVIPLGGVFNEPWLWWLGLADQNRPSFDFVPMLPWLAPFLTGLAVSKFVGARLPAPANKLGITAQNRWKIIVATIGRHSLVFYLLHQPVLIAILYGVSFVAPPPVVDPSEAYIQNCRPSCERNQTPGFCQSFCDCTLESLSKTDLLASFQSGAISVSDDRIKDIAFQCSIRSE
ncbi:heparan-alpha-glucosaminide N-acetyltransferase [Rhizobium sp. FKL33]|uniref:heparan-alpha-glucosaminide N-acetyltransferase n=1 Tax=Rhizobium sp. FKL33 TaxID=2562307 RepID=UPI001FEE0270|nr:heparan-alpha-glucosaminide N-acetyltransferase [Rhizobium sp. FKL33]